MDEKKLEARPRSKTSAVRVRGVIFIVIVACLTIAGWTLASLGARQSTTAHHKVDVMSRQSMTSQDVYVGYKDIVYRLSAHNGSVVWQHALQQPMKPNRIDGSIMQVQAINQDLVSVQLENTVFVLHKSDGSELWHYAFTQTTDPSDLPRAYIGNVLFDQQRAYIDLSVGDLVGLDLQTGQQLWKMAGVLPNGGEIAAFNGSIYVSKFDQQGQAMVYAIDGTTGRELWHFQREMWGNSSLQHSFAMADGILYDGGNPLYALDAHTGKKLWEQRLADRASFFTQPYVVNGKLYADVGATVATDLVGTATTQASGKPQPEDALYAFEVKTGKQLWKSQPGYRVLWINGQYPLANKDAIVLESVMHLNDSRQPLQILDPQSGALRWQTTLSAPACGPHTVCWSPRVQLAGDTLLVFDGDAQTRTVRQFDLRSGKLLARHAVSLPLKEEPEDMVVDQDHLYVRTGLHGGGQYSSGSSNTFWDYNLYAIDLASGKTAWQYKIGKLIEYREPISSLVLMP